MEREVTCNDEQRLFVIPSGSSGWSAFGYDNCYREAKALQERLLQHADALSPEAVKALREHLEPKESEIGTLGQYRQHRELISILDRFKVDLGTWFAPGTPKAVEKILEDSRRSKQRLRITYGDGESGRIWSDRAMIGRISRSTGVLQIPLLISSRRSTGGYGLLSDCIVRIQASPGGVELYRHPKLHESSVEAKQEEAAAMRP